MNTLKLVILALTFSLVVQINFYFMLQVVKGIFSVILAKLMLVFSLCLVLKFVLASFLLI